MALLLWGDEHAATPEGPPRVIVHAACGHDAHPEQHCAHCGEVLETRDVKVRPGPGASARQLAEPLLP